MFKETLQGVVEGTDGGIAGLLMDFEGIPLEIYTKGEAGFDMETVGAEISVVVKSIQRASQMLSAGETHEVAFQADALTTIIRVVNETYFVAVALAPEANFGKARYLLRIAVPKLLAELS